MADPTRLRIHLLLLDMFTPWNVTASESGPKSYHLLVWETGIKREVNQAPPVLRLVYRNIVRFMYITVAAETLPHATEYHYGSHSCSVLSE